jgi:hypothetical protein
MTLLIDGARRQTLCPVIGCTDHAAHLSLCLTAAHGPHKHVLKRTSDQPIDRTQGRSHARQEEQVVAVLMVLPDDEW